VSAFLELRRLGKRFGELKVLDGVSLEIEEGETLVLLGPSGSGKTTLLRAIAGFEPPDSGSILIEGLDVTAVAPAQRNFGMVFQHYALFPHLTVAENVAFGLESRGVDRTAAARRVRDALELVELGEFGRRRVDQISGGQQQRVALARALAPEPRVLLLDEPLSNLDPALRERTRRQIRAAVRSVGITAVWVTHEQEEAFDVGDRVAVLDRGVLQQVGSPEDLYLVPRSPFVARFVGRASAIEGVWRGRGRVEIVGREGVTVDWRAASVEPLSEGARVTVYYRPEGLALVEAGSRSALIGEVVERRYGGASTLYTVADQDGRTLEVEGNVSAATVGQTVGVEPRDDGPAGVAFGQPQRSSE
jgi:putative spermidine/putrescine transport system ATP-binding protein/mannopine transport system ATP-binding protein